tara:strand:- start:2824 stop:2970 length:147 start_codon:yes stop_codon:yes gene_type:complete
MLVINVAEWITNVFILGVAALTWAISLFIMLLIASLIKDRIEKYLIKG